MTDHSGGRGLGGGAALQVGGGAPFHTLVAFAGSPIDYKTSRCDPSKSTIDWQCVGHGAQNSSQCICITQHITPVPDLQARLIAPSFLVCHVQPEPCLLRALGLDCGWHNPLAQLSSHPA